MQGFTAALRIGVPAAALLAGLAACGPTSSPNSTRFGLASGPRMQGKTSGIPTTDPVPPGPEEIWGKRALAAFLDVHPPVDDSELQARVFRVGESVARVSDAKDRVFDFIVVEGLEPQAFSFMNGTVCVSRKLTKLLTTEDELAFVLAHELAHIILRHQISNIHLQQALNQLEIKKRFSTELFLKIFSRGAELEADQFGALYAVRAGYRFSAAPAALNRIASSPGMPEEDPDHPSFRERQNALLAFRPILEAALAAFDLGLEAFHTGDFDTAIERLRLFVTHYPNSYAGRVNLGSAYLAKERMYSTLPAHLEEVLPTVPDPGILLRGILDPRLIALARQHFEVALKYAPPETTDVRIALAAIFTRLDQLERARNHLVEAMDLTPGKPEIPLSLGNVEFVAQDYPRAVSHYREALSLRDNWPEAKKNLALAFERMGRWNEAHDLWTDLAPIPKFSPEAGDHLARLDSILQQEHSEGIP